MNNEEIDVRDLNDAMLTDAEQDYYFPLTEEEKKQWQTWVPEGYKITNMLIYEAKKRGIPMPTGNPEHDQEYRMFLDEHILTVVKKNRKIIEPPYIDPPYRGNGFKTPPFITGITPSSSSSDIYIQPINKRFTNRENDGATNDDSIIVTSDNQNGIGENPIPPQPPTNEPIISDNQNGIGQNPIPPQPPTNEPVDISEITKAIEDELKKDEENILVKIVESKKISIIPFIIASILALIASMFRINAPLPKKTEQELVSKTLNYVLKENISYEDAFKIATSDIRMGDYHYIFDGEKFNTHSMMSGDKNFPGETKEMGKEFSNENKHQGSYPITGFSIIRKSDNKILAYIEDFYEQRDNTRLSSFVDKTLKENNVAYEDIRVEIHYGRTTDKEKNRLGWKNETAMINKEIKSIINIASKYQGEIDNFQGNSITIRKNGKDIAIPIKDSNGNLYKSGTIVKGSDNNEYEITSLNLKENKIGTSQALIFEKPKLTFDIEDCKIATAAPFMLGAVAYYLKKKHENETALDNPYYKLINNKDQKNYINDFQNNEASTYKITHKAELFLKENLEKMIINAYHKKTGTIEEIENLNYMIDNENRIIINHKEHPEKNMI